VQQDDINCYELYKSGLPNRLYLLFSTPVAQLL